MASNTFELEAGGVRRAMNKQSNIEWCSLGIVVICLRKLL